MARPFPPGTQAAMAEASEKPPKMATLPGCAIGLVHLIGWPFLVGWAVSVVWAQHVVPWGLPVLSMWQCMGLWVAVRLGALLVTGFPQVDRTADANENATARALGVLMFVGFSTFAAWMAS